MFSVTNVQGILLDFDGTIADTHALIFECYEEVLKVHAGITLPRSGWDQYCGLPMPRTLELVLDDFKIESIDLNKMVESYRALVRERDGNVQAFPGMIDTLRELDACGIKLGIVSTKYTPLVERHAVSLGIRDLFRVLIGGDQCVNVKPHPEPFLKGLAGLGLDASVVAGIGDSRFDVEASRAAGLYAIAATWGTTDLDGLLATQPNRVMHRAEELLELTR